MRIGTGIGGEGEIEAILERFRKAEADGFASAWMSNIFGVDALTTLALAGRVTSKMELGSFVVPTYPRHPMALAQQALTAQAASNGRLLLGIGLSHKVVIENMMGLDYSKPIRHSREYLTVLNGLLEGRPVQFKGEEYRVAGQMTVSGAKKPPILMAALGPQMLKLAGNLADGTAVWMGGPKYLETTCIPIISAAAREAGRPAPRIVAGFPIAATNKVESARESAGKSFSIYGTLPSYRAIMDVEGAPDASAIAIVGDEKSVESQLRHLASIGVTDLNASGYRVEDDPGALQRTQEFLVSLAKKGELKG